ncbi:MAG: glycerol kinase GlpK [candidate division KSB1 bacterium]|nr:glycerol kinase GlpK [candidate division KSB1 bacterium]
MDKVILAIDEGTTGVTTLLIDRKGEIVGRGYSEFPQIYPRPGWVEHDAEAIWQTTRRVISEAMRNGRIEPHRIAGIGITNQRETTVIWDRSTGKPIYNAIVWQCRRTADQCAELRARGLEAHIHAKTGLVLDPYFSATKIAWILDHVPNARPRAESGELLFGTIDTWLLWKLTDGAVYATDHTNASRTLLYNIHNKQWDDELLQIFHVPRAMLPRIETSSGVFGFTSTNGDFGREIPIAGIAGDQQAALYGQGCTRAGTIKNTYGTGCFIMMNTGDKLVDSRSGLLTTIACDELGRPNYALEGSVFIAGAAIQWLRDELKLIEKASDSEAAARAVPDTNGVYLVPAFVGLGAPHWDMEARGVIVGLTRGAKREHLIRAALEAIAYQSCDVIEAMRQDADLPINELRVDGGAAQNDFLMQFQADLLDLPIRRPRQIESTALGAAYLAGLAVKFWETPDQIEEQSHDDRVFSPAMSREKREALLAGWRRAVKTCRYRPD